MRKTSTAVAALFVGLVVSSCDLLAADPGKKVISDAMEGARVFIDAESNYYAPFGSACFDRGLAEKTPVTVIAHSGGREAWQKMEFAIDVAAAVRPFAPPDPERPVMQFQGTLMDCFLPSAMKPYHLMARDYQVTVGNAHVEKIDFVNDISGQMRSYHLTFSVRAPGNANSNAPIYHTALTTTCVVVKNEIENTWVLQGC